MFVRVGHLLLFCKLWVSTSLSLVSLLSFNMSMILIEWICSGQVELFWLWGATKLDNDDTLCSFSMKSRLVATE
jgi:hypothetical protein